MALGRGIDVDMETGIPLEAPPKAPHGPSHQEDLYGRAQTLQAALSDATGHAVLDKMTGLFAKRVTTLIEADPECQAYVRLMREIGHELTLGRKAAEALLYERTGVRPDRTP